MDDFNQNKIYIRVDEEIPSIVDKIKKCAEREIILIIPRNAFILNNVVNLKILKKEAEGLDKKVLVITADDGAEIKNENISMESVKYPKRKIAGSVAGNDEFLKSEKDNEAGDLSNKDSEIGDFSFDDKNNEAGIARKKIVMADVVKKEKDLDAKKEIREFDEKKIYNENLFEKQRENFGKTSANNKAREKERFIKPPKTKKRTITLPSISSKIAALFILASFAAVSLAVAFILPKADIAISLKTETAPYDFEFTADESLEKIDAANSKIPLQKIEVASEESETYPATGKKHMQETASGEITVFNEYSSTPQRLVADPVSGYTRFLSKDGHLFRIKEPVTIPGFSRIEGVDVPGQVTVKIYADKPGEDYNIAPTSFSLPKLQEIQSPKYPLIYARSTKAMSGGIDKDVLYFSEGDYATAKEKLLKLAGEKNEKDFLSKISDQSQILEDTKKEEEPEINTNVKMGTAADNFQMNVKITTSANLILKADLDEIINEKLISRLATDKKFLENGRDCQLGEITTDQDGKIIIPTHINQKLITKIDAENLKKEIAGKSEAELKTYFSNMSGVESTNINLWPFWVKSIPSSYEKINITIDINDSV